MEKINKLSIPVTIIISSIILGGFYYSSQIYKQNSIEKQKQAEVDLLKKEENRKEILLQFCLDEAHNKYKDSAKYWLDLENKIKASDIIESIEREKNTERQDKDECYKRYK